MNVKTMITGLALSMLLSSGTANADWGDVYYCQMTNNIEITLEGEMTNYKLEKFQFKLDQTKHAMVFGSKSYLGGEVLKLNKGDNVPLREYWLASARYTITDFLFGKFLFTHNGSGSITSISADCEKF
jgi:hypothetical protein